MLGVCSGGQWRKAPRAFPDSNSVLDMFKSVSEAPKALPHLSVTASQTVLLLYRPMNSFPNVLLETREPQLGRARYYQIYAHKIQQDDSLPQPFPNVGKVTVANYK